MYIALTSLSQKMCTPVYSLKSLIIVKFLKQSFTHNAFNSHSNYAT